MGQRAGEARVRRWIERRGHWVGLYPQDLERAQRTFARHGRWIVFAGRLIPGVRTLISVPAGIAAMPRAQFLLWSAAGTALWTTILAFGGWGLGRRYERLGALLHEIATAVFACIALVIVVRAIRIRGARRGRRSSR